MKDKAAKQPPAITAQPDTSTLAGKIAVMQAALEEKGIQFKTPGVTWLHSSSPAWDWTEADYRIHPDDLNPPPQPSWKPWKPEEVPVGTIVTPKNKPLYKLLILGVNHGQDVLIVHSTYTPSSVLEHFQLLDGSPCGVQESA